MLNRISRVLLALILTVSLVTEPVAVALAVDNTMAQAYSIESSADGEESGGNAGEDADGEITEGEITDGEIIEGEEGEGTEGTEDTEETVTIEPVQIKEIKIAENTDKDVVITWEAREDVTVNVERALEFENPEWTTVAENLTEGTYTDKTTEYDTEYFYRLKAVSVEDPAITVFSDPWQNIKTNVETLVPVEIDDITLNNDKEITLTWTVDERVTAQLQRSLTGKDGSWVNIKDGFQYSLGKFTDKTAVRGKTYYYRLKTKWADRESDAVAYSKTEKMSTSKMILKAPTLNKPVFKTSDDVKLTWKNVTGATHYKVWRKTSSGSWTSIKKVKASTGTTTSWTNYNVSTTKIYYYRIQPVAEGFNTNVVYSSSKKCHSPFKAVSVKKPTASIGKITVKWSKVNFAQEYKVYRKKSGGSWVLKKTVKAGSTLSYTDKNVGSRIKYYYKVIPKSDYTTGTKYNSVYAYSRLFKTTAKVKSRTKTTVTLKWNKVNNATSYGVFKSTDGKNWTKVKETKNLSYKVQNLKTKKKYYFKVRTYCKKNGKTLDTRDSSVKKTATRYSGPSQVTIWRGTSTATLKWSSVSGAEKYIVYMSSNKGKSYKKVYSGTSRSFKKSGCSEKVTYYFKVYALDTIGGVETRSTYHKEISLAPKYNNFTMLNLKSSDFLSMMKKRSTTNYYLGTPYGSIKDDPNITVTEAGFTRPNGMNTSKKKRMNCAGFIGSIFRDAGADLTVVRQMGYSYGTANACNWVSFFNYSDVKKYKYRSVQGLLNSGRAEKGDIICRIPDKFDKEENHDYHMMVFWGSNSYQNKMWHSTYQWGRSCNQISALPEQDYACTYVLVKLKR